MEKLNLKLNKGVKRGLIHNSRKDVRLLADYVNILIAKVNELVEDNNKLRTELGKTKNNQR